MYVEYVPDCLGIDVSKPQCWLEFSVHFLKGNKKVQDFAFNFYSYHKSY